MSHINIFMRHLLNYSESNIWEVAKEEWNLDHIEWEPAENNNSCICGYSPICELCYIKNIYNDIILLVGNVCINKFTNLSSNLIFNNIKKISKNIEKSLNNSTIEYCFNKNLINDWEYNFLYDTERKRKLTFKQYNKRVSINKKILHSFKSGML
tara:strand:- start:1596 stop:2057 length:462 start_codon:yes stop_codon:yes gene_type:complete